MFPINNEVDLEREWTYKQVWDTLPKFKKCDRVVSVDSDALCFRIAAACDTKTILVSNGKKVREFKTRTEFKRLCKDKGWDYAKFTIEDKVVSEDVSHCLATLKRAIRNLKERFDATHMYHFLGGKHNARCDLKLPVQYKSNRSGAARPTHLKECRDYLIKNHGAFVVTGVEADDLVQGLSQHIVNETEACGIAFNLDKDFNQSLLFNRFYNPIKDTVTELSGGLGKLWLENDKVKGEGLLWLMQQLMISDPSDAYFMNSHYIKKYGEKSFYKDFKDCKSEKELLTKVVSKWKELLPESIEYTSWCGEVMKPSWLELAELYMTCCYMKTSPDDSTTFESLLKEYKIEY